jgi:hypothetical protein
MKILIMDGFDYAPFKESGREHFPIHIEEQGILLWRKTKIIENGKLICEVDGQNVRLLEGETGKLYRPINLGNLGTWVKIKTRKFELETVCVRKTSKACSTFLSFILKRDKRKIGYMVTKHETGSTFKGSLIPDYEMDKWFISFSAYLIRKTIESRD